MKTNQPHQTESKTPETNARVDQIVSNVVDGLLELGQRHVHAVIVEVVVAVLSKPTI